jgi:hypothetical protein
MFGLHASLTLSDETLAACRDAVEGQGVGFHPCSRTQCGRIRFAWQIGHAGGGPPAAVWHFRPGNDRRALVHVDAREIALLAESGTWVSHQPRSNMNNAVGLPQVESMLRAGVKVCLGNDGFTNAMWEEWKTAYLAHKLINQDPRRLSALDIVQMAIRNNSALAERLLPGAPLGVLQPGAAPT